MWKEYIASNESLEIMSIMYAHIFVYRGRCELLNATKRVKGEIIVWCRDCGPLQLTSRLPPGHGTYIFLCYFNSPGSIQPCHATPAMLGTYRTHCNHSPTRYSFTPEWSETHKGRMSFPMTQNRNNSIQRWEGRIMIFLWKGCTKRAWNSHDRQCNCKIGRHPSPSLA